jgi:hypothetical protein
MKTLLGVLCLSILWPGLAIGFLAGLLIGSIRYGIVLSVRFMEWIKA